MRDSVVAGVVIATLAGFGAAERKYRLDLGAANARLAALERATFESRFGTIEYVDTGSGPPLLVSHGIFHGFDGGRLAVEGLVEGRRVIVPSRFGYLGTAMPPDATGADQADAFAAVLDHLGLESVDVIAISAGTSPAVQFALRHPRRVRRLAISSGSFPGSPTAVAPPNWARVFYSDRAMWTLKTFARPMFAGLMGIPSGFPRTDDDVGVIDQMLASIFPIGPRAPGAIHDAYVSNPEITSSPLEEIAVPTLIIHAKDDPLASYQAAADAADRMQAANLVTLESGGHLQLGQSDRVRNEVESFLGRT